MTRDEINGLKKYLENLDPTIDDRGEIDTINRQILETWDKRIEEAISIELKQKLGDVEIEKTRSFFDLISEEQGAAIYKLFFNIVDIDEKIEVIVKFVLFHNKNEIYLGSRHANEETFEGQSEVLNRLFRVLKTANKDQGYFHPIDFYGLID